MKNEKSIGNLAYMEIIEIYCARKAQTETNSKIKCVISVVYRKKGRPYFPKNAKDNS